jgi:hypothetical protein
LILGVILQKTYNENDHGCERVLDGGVDDAFGLLFVVDDVLQLQ